MNNFSNNLSNNQEAGLRPASSAGVDRESVTDDATERAFGALKQVYPDFAPTSPDHLCRESLLRLFGNGLDADEIIRAAKAYATDANTGRFVTKPLNVWLDSLKRF